MIPDLQNLEFLRPHALWALLMLPLILGLARRSGASKNPWSTHLDPVLLAALFPTVDGRPRQARLRGWLPALAWVLVCIALAGPSLGRTKVPTAPPQSQALVVMGLSQSMRAEDLSPDRLTRARIAAGEWIAERDGEDIGLVVFAGSAFRVSPLTRDQDTLRHLLNSVQPDVLPRDGHDIPAALQLASTLFTARSGIRELLLISDHDFSVRDEQAIAEVTDDGIRVAVLGLGTTDGAPVPLANGRFATARDGSLAMVRVDLAAQRRSATRNGARWLGVDDIRAHTLGTVPLERLSNDTESPEAHAGRKSEVPRDDGIWLVFPLLLIAALGFRRGLLWLALMSVTPALLSTLPTAAYAEGTGADTQLPTSPDWTLNRDIRAYRNWRRDPTAETARQLPSAEWRGTAAFESGDFEKAATEFANGEGVDALYNQALALAHADRIDEALKRFESVLEQDPNHADARHNRDLLQQVKQQQQSQQNSAQQQGESGESGENTESESGESQQSGQNQPGQESADSNGDPNDGQQDGESPPQQNAENASANEAQSAQSPRDEEARSAAEQAQQGESPQDAPPPDDDGQSESEAASLTASPSDEAETERALRQWLRRVDSDPARLLRERFRRLEQDRRQDDTRDNR